MITSKPGATRKWLYLIRRRPKRYESVDKRKLLWINLHTDSVSVAQAKSEIVWQELLEAWEAKLAGADDDAAKHFDAAKRLAASRSLRYLRATEVAALPLREIVDRAKLARPWGQPLDPVEARAVLGGAPEPKITLSKALELYWNLAREKDARHVARPTPALAEPAQESHSRSGPSDHRQADGRDHWRRHAELPGVVA